MPEQPKTLAVNPPPQTKASALAIMAGKFSVEPQKLLDTLKATVFKNASNEELLALVVVANSYGLNPLCKEIYAFPAKGGGIVPVVSVDGWIQITNSHPQYDGVDFEFHHDDEGNLESCTAIIYRKDRQRPIRVREYLSECKRNTEPWKMEHRMLRHKALIQAARVAFGFSGIYDEEDAEMIDVTDKVKVVSGKVGQPGPVNPLLEAKSSDTAAAETTTAPAKRKPREQQPEQKEEPPPADDAQAMQPTEAAQEKPAAPAASQTDDLRADLVARCKAAGIEDSELVLYLAGQGFLPKGTTFKALTGVQIKAILDKWDDVKDGVTGA